MSTAGARNDEQPARKTYKTGNSHARNGVAPWERSGWRNRAALTRLFPLVGPLSPARTPRPEIAPEDDEAFPSQESERQNATSDGENVFCHGRRDGAGRPECDNRPLLHVVDGFDSSAFFNLGSTMGAPK